MELIVKLLKDRKYLEQIMLSNNINFKVQLKKYGGFGYANLFVNYKQRLVEGAGLNDDEVNKLFGGNLLNLLAWWEPPKKQEKKVNMITCVV
jgi:hypothetical protein